MSEFDVDWEENSCWICQNAKNMFFYYEWIYLLLFFDEMRKEVIFKKVSSKIDLDYILGLNTVTISEACSIYIFLWGETVRVCAIFLLKTKKYIMNWF